MKRRAIFLDRDGTINLDSGYVSSVEEFQLYGFAAPAIRMINESGWLAIVVTNQVVIGRGLCREEDVRDIHDTMDRRLAAEGARIDAIYLCPHYPPAAGPQANTQEDGVRPDLRIECGCRKPRPGLIHQAERDHSLDLGACWMIGDRYRDLAAGYEAGTRGVLVGTGQGAREYAQERTEWPRQPEAVTPNLLEAVKWILATERSEREESR